jgi:hypothetical protein
MVTFIRGFFLLRPTHLTFTTKVVAFASDVSRDLALHRIIRRATIYINAETGCVACFILNFHRLRMCGSAKEYSEKYRRARG